MMGFAHILKSGVAGMKKGLHLREAMRHSKQAMSSRIAAQRVHGTDAYAGHMNLAEAHDKAEAAHKAALHASPETYPQLAARATEASRGTNS